jgi:uncharacterized surface protein with fasciclin (FAS1) repeats
MQKVQPGSWSGRIEVRTSFITEHYFGVFRSVTATKMKVCTTRQSRRPPDSPPHPALPVIYSSKTGERKNMKLTQNWKRSFLVLITMAVALVGLSIGTRAFANSPAAKKDIVETAIAAGQFKTLAAALQAAGLVDTLKGNGPFTVFAPTDAAFAKLPAGTVDNLLKPENKDKLVAILTYHVVAGRVTSAQVVKMDSAKTLNGEEISIRSTMGKVMINDATVTKADIDCSNGVIHVIDTVLMPK